MLRKFLLLNLPSEFTSRSATAGCENPRKPPLEDRDLTCLMSDGGASEAGHMVEKLLKVTFPGTFESNVTPLMANVPSQSEKRLVKPIASLLLHTTSGGAISRGKRKQGRK